VSQALKASLLAILASLLVAVFNFGMRALADLAPVAQTGFIVALTVFILTAAHLFIFSPGISPWPQMKAFAAARGTALTASLLATIYGFSHLPQQDAYAIGFTEPIVSTLIAAIIFRERISGGMMLAIAIGFGGVLVTLGQDFSSDISFWHGVAAAGVIASVGDMLLLRHTGRREALAVGAFWPGICVPIVFGLLFWLSGESPVVTPLALAAPILLGAISWISIRPLMMAIAVGPVAAVAPIKYMRLPIGLALAGIFLHEDVAGHELLGSAMVVGGGIWLVLPDRGKGSRPRLVQPETSRPCRPPRIFSSGGSHTA